MAFFTLKRMQEKIEVVKATDPRDLETVFAIRRKVFVEEQKCPPELEWEFEDISVHFLAFHNGMPAGAARWRRTEKGYKLERFAVLSEFRGMGVGSALVKAVLADLPDDAEYIYLHAQIHAVDLYRKSGFTAVGEQFEEAGIRHYKMIFEDRPVISGSHPQSSIRG